MTPSVGPAGALILWLPPSQQSDAQPTEPTGCVESKQNKKNQNFLDLFCANLTIQSKSHTLLPMSRNAQ